MIAAARLQPGEHRLPAGRVTPIGADAFGSETIAELAAAADDRRCES
jgi:hypothetical protein